MIEEQVPEGNLSQQNNLHEEESGTDKVVSQINARTKIIEILTKVETRQAFTDKLLDREIDELNEMDRSLVTEVVNGVLRWQYRLDWILSQLYVGEYENLIPDVKNNLRASTYQLIYLDQIPAYAVLNEAVEIAKNKFNQKTANLINAILRNFLRQQKKLEYLEMQLEVLDRIAVKFSHPKWLVQRWIEFWGIDEVEPLCEYNNSRPRISVRINRLMADNESFLKTLEENNISYEVHKDFPDFVWIDNFLEFRKLDFLKKGWVSVQDVSAGIPVLLLDPRPGEYILDMCAAPGGKAGYIAEKMRDHGFILAIERHFSRAKIFKDNLSRLNIKITNTVCADSLQLPTKIQFDKVLIDAPCTGFGVLNKRVDLRWKRTLQDIENMKNIQVQLLESAAKVVKPDGIIIYSTCTIDPEENELVVGKFIKNNPEFSVERVNTHIPEQYLSEKSFVKTFPHKHGIDGTFAVKIRKNKN
jgi:16S rRNA (cytosine967-C5)-methyltransferase